MRLRARARSLTAKASWSWPCPGSAALRSISRSISSEKARCRVARNDVRRSALRSADPELLDAGHRRLLGVEDGLRLACAEAAFRPRQLVQSVGFAGPVLRGPTPDESLLQGGQRLSRPARQHQGPTLLIEDIRPGARASRFSQQREGSSRSRSAAAAAPRSRWTSARSKRLDACCAGLSRPESAGELRERLPVPTRAASADSPSWRRATPRLLRVVISPDASDSALHAAACGHRSGRGQGPLRLSPRASRQR